MRIAFGLRLALLTFLGAGISGFWNPATAIRFDQREVDQTRLIAIAAPVGGTSHQLLILQQISDRRPCWQESGSSPTVVDPLLVNFDFAGICSRSPDSNGYSVRIGGEDLGLQYRLRVVEREHDLVLIAVADGDRNAPPLEIGRAHGTTNGFAKIDLNPGWRMTQRVYNGQTLPHIYLENDQDLSTLIATATQSHPISPTPSANRPPVLVSPTPPANLPTVPVSPTPGVGRLPVRPSPLPAPVVRPPLTVPTVGDTGLPPSPSPVASQAGLSYRVIVEATTLEQQNQVRAISPEAFRTLVNGRAVMQAGLFRDQQTANQLQQRLSSENLPARVIPVSGGTVSGGGFPQPPPQPQINPSPMPDSVAGLPQPRGRTVIVIDPGHGGVDVGAVGVGGLRESGVVFAIAQQVATLLEQQGVQAVLTRQGDQEIDLQPRVDLSDRVNANLFVSIHANSAGSSSNANGVETYYYASAAGQQLAQSIQTNMIRTTGMIDRGVKQARFYVLTQTSMPAALVEVGFVTGREDASRLSNSASRTQIAGAITRGILEYIQHSR